MPILIEQLSVFPVKSGVNARGSNKEARPAWPAPFSRSVPPSCVSVSQGDMTDDGKNRVQPAVAIGEYSDGSDIAAVIEASGPFQ